MHLNYVIGDLNFICKPSKFAKNIQTNFIINYWHIDKGQACAGTINLQARSDPLSGGI